MIPNSIEFNTIVIATLKSSVKAYESFQVKFCSVKILKIKIQLIDLFHGFPTQKLHDHDKLPTYTIKSYVARAFFNTLL